MNTSALFRPFSHGSLQLPNRIVMAPMTRRSSPGGIPNEAVADYYRRRAEGGVGLIISEGATIGSPAAGVFVATDAGEACRGGITGARTGVSSAAATERSGAAPWTGSVGSTWVGSASLASCDVSEPFPGADSGSTSSKMDRPWLSLMAPVSLIEPAKPRPDT